MDKFDSSSFDHWLLRVDHEVEEGVDTRKLIVGDGSNGLLTHSTLVSVPGGLIVMGIRYKTGDSAQDSKWLDLQMGGCCDYVGFIECDVRIVLFVHIEVFHETISEEVIKRRTALLKFLGGKDVINSP